ncbi:1-acyl-sn-glycerol-3-phosphate acyltransferase [Prevotella sp. KH2C16]|uniref:1-acyl-sn-glycerol-3-phosphate acyltransferase n=1 Tax=Prevotella sp. KH2C16 TaxID=1855325 RepID=UPI0008EE6A36|nr:1-acyl-sn-glycerol-3-phosphate acyltransferase [Prevotella sp. KH2C16]SFG06040.1 Acyltransferase [Prevotella sp. KH2C16]
MNIPEKFDSIRPFEPEELPEVYDRLLQNGQFCQVVKYFYPQVPLEMVARKMKGCKSSLEFQLAFCYDIIKNLLEKASLGCDFNSSVLDVTRRFTFISNHRDIVLDSAILDVLLFDAGFKTTCEIAIGDNLLSLPWVKDLVRVNKSFIVERDLPMREMLMASRRLSEYMHFVIGEKNDNVWIAQREGRAKDSNDRTQEAVLKMMTMGGTGSLADRLVQLHLVPLSISYEFDPCDYLKAKEFQQRRDIVGWKKGPQDDLVSMQTGIMGFKGHIHYHAAPCIDDFLRSLDPDLPKNDFYRVVAEHIDQEIHRNYRLYPVNYLAMDLLAANHEHAAYYSEADKAQFEQYLAAQMAKIDLENKDEAFLRERMLTMYANPAINHLAAQ